MHYLRAESLFHMPQVMCDVCVAAVGIAVRAIDAKARLEADLEAGTLRVISNVYPTALLRTLRDAGFLAEQVLQPLG